MLPPPPTTGQRHRAWEMAAGAPAFNPGQVPEIAAGYWWDPAVTTGSGATLTMVEMGGKTSYNQVTPAAGEAPSTATINGQTVMAYTNGSPDRIFRTSATQTRGFSGGFVLWGWISCSSAPGSIWGHWRTANNILLQLTATDIRFYCRDTSPLTNEARFPLPAGGYAAGPFFGEFVFDPSQGVATNRMQAFYDRVQQTPTLAPSPGTTLTDTSEFLTFGGTVGDNNATNYSADWKHGVFGITNGIPSTGNRDLTYGFKALK